MMKAWMLRGVDLEVLPEQVFEPRGVQHGARADHPGGGEAGQLERHIGEDVNRVGHHQQDGVPVAADDLGDDRPENLHVLAYQVDARLAGGLRRARRDDHQPGVGQVGVISRVDVDGTHEGDAVGDVHRLSLRLLLVDVEQHQLGKQSAAQQGVGGGRAHRTAADDRAFL